MTELLEKQGVVTSADAFFKEIMEREKLMSTGIGRGVAMPHARTSSAQDLKVAVYLLDNELEFEAIDGEPVKIIFMIAVPESLKELYMRIMSAIANFFRSEENRSKVLNCSSVDELYEILEGIKYEV